MNLPLFGPGGFPLFSSLRKPATGNESCDTCYCPLTEPPECEPYIPAAPNCVCFDPIGDSPFVGFIQPDYYYVSTGNLSPEGGCSLGRWDEPFSILWGPGLGNYHQAIADDALSAFLNPNNFKTNEDGEFTCDYAYTFFMGTAACIYAFYPIISTRPLLYVTCGCSGEGGVDGAIGVGLAWAGDTGGFNVPGGYQKPDPYKPLSSGSIDCPVPLPFGPVACDPVYTINPGADRVKTCSVSIGEAELGYVARVPFLENVEISRLSAGCEIEEPCLSGPVASFTATRTYGNGCLFAIVNTSNCGACNEEDCRYFWSDGYEGKDRPPYRVRLGSAGCGRVTQSLVLVVIDKRGCKSIFERRLTCGCCCVSGSLSAEQLDEDGCYWRICASVSDNGECTGAAFIEWALEGAGVGCVLDDYYEDCECGDPNDFNDCYDGRGCIGGGLADTDCTNVTITSNSRIRYRVWDTQCGCAGEEQFLELGPCSNCDCCDEGVSGALITFAGFSNCEGEELIICPCTPLNTTHNVPTTGVCSGTLVIPISCTAPQGGPNQEGTFNVYWTMLCDEIGYWLEVGYFFDVSGAGPGGSDIIFIDDDKPICAGVTGSGTIDLDPTFCLLCGVDLVTFTVELY